MVAVLSADPHAAFPVVDPEAAAAFLVAALGACPVAARVAASVASPSADEAGACP